MGDSLGNNAKAVEICRKALAVVEPLAREHLNDLAVQRAQAAIQEQLGTALQVTGQFKEAFDRLQNAAGSFDQIARANPGDLQSLQDAGVGWQLLGRLMSEKGGYITFNSDAPLANLNKSVKYLQAALLLDERNEKTIESLVPSIEAIGRVDAQASPPKGIQDFSEALSLLGRLPESMRSSVDVQQMRARILVLLGWSQGQIGDFKSSLATLQEARPILDAQVAADPSNVGAQFRQMDVYRSLALVEDYAGDDKKSLEYMEKAAKILEGAVERDSANTNYQVVLAELRGRVAMLLVHAGRQAEALPYAEASVTYFRALGDRPDATPSQLMECVRSLDENGIASLRDYPTALRFAQKAAQFADGKNPAVLGYLAEAYALNKKYPEAVQSAQRGLSAMTPTKPGEPPSRLRNWLDSELKEYQAKAH